MNGSYIERRSQLKTYFDRTASEAWARLTSDAPVSRIRATVRAGRDEMRATLLSWLPSDLSGTRLLDAGCGTGALSVEAASRGASVLAIDLSPTLVSVARDRLPPTLGAGSIEFASGDMLAVSLGRFEHVVCMDSLIHYRAHDVVHAVSRLAARTSRSILVTFAPRTAALAAMHAAGKLFPRGDRAPAIEPVAEALLRKLLSEDHSLSEWQVSRSHRVRSGFYTSHALELVRR